MTRMNSRILPFFTWLLCLGVAFYLGLAPIVHNDFWLQAKVGEIIVQEHSIPSTLLFPYTEIGDSPFNAHEWLASVLFHVGLQGFGEYGLPIAVALLSSCLLVAASVLAYIRNGHQWHLALLCGLVVIATENYRHFLRPELLATLIMVMYWIALETCLRRRSTPALGIAMLLACIWTNTHGSFILAPILAAIYALGAWLESFASNFTGLVEQRIEIQRATIVFVAIVLSTLVNPFGLELHAFVFQFSAEDYVRAYVPEWFSPWQARHTEARGLVLGYVICTVTLLRLVRDALTQQLRATEALFFIAFVLLGVTSIRFILYQGIVAAYILSRPRADDVSFLHNKMTAYGLACAIALTALALAVPYGNAYRAFPLIGPANVKFTPGLVRALQQSSVRGNVLNSLELGAELVYRSYPRLRPSLDSRIDSYGLQYILYQQALLTDDALLHEYVERYDVRYVLLDVVRFKTFSQLGSFKDGTWKILYRSSKEVLLERSTASAGTQP